MNDHELLTAVKAAVTEQVPAAVSMALETSDQAYHGFVLRDVALPDGQSLLEREPALLADLSDRVADNLSDLCWDGVVGEDRHGYATVQLT